MPRRAAVYALALCLLAAVPAAAQLPAPQPPGPYAIDIRGAIGRFPQDPAFFPLVPADTFAPSRGFGFDIGGHVYLFHLGPARVGFGANLLRLSSTSTPPEEEETRPGRERPPRTIPDVRATLTAVAPQVSFNFGSSNGWSYLSAGYGIAQMTGSTSGTLTTFERDSGRLPAINIGGGARWFTTPRMAFSFDVRFHLVSAKEQSVPLLGTAKTTLVLASVGLSLR